jgi:parvulin-like peptidyl-prolyl isomerase
VDRRSPKLLFALGAAVGLGVALFTALGPLDSGAEAGDLAARVGDGGVSRASYQRAIEALEADKRNPLTAADRARALDRLIDEELLIQRGIELGLAASEPSVRKAIVDAMVQFATVQGGERAPTDAELKRFYDTRPDLFRSDPALRVAAAALPDYDPAATGQLARFLRDGTSFDAAARAVGATLLPIPDMPLSAGKLTDYAGPTVRDTALGLSPGETAGAVETGGRLVMVQLLERHAGVRAPFETVRAEVEEAWRRVERDQALESYLAELRRGTSVVKE